MNNWIPLETKLRSWTPRAPSQRLKAQLFDQTDASLGAGTNASGDDLPFSWQWVAPSMALILIATFLLGHQTGVLGLSSATSPGLIATASLDHPDLATYYYSSRHSENNTPVVGVEGTNRYLAVGGTPTNQVLH